MSGRVLVVPRAAFAHLPQQGAWPCPPTDPTPAGQWLARDQAETDERFLQIIPYALIQDAAGRLWCYERLGGDARLQRRRSCGVGGHVDEADRAADLPAMAAQALGRELAEELGWVVAPAGLSPVAWLYEGLSAVGRVHLGLIYIMPWLPAEPPRPAPGEPLAGLGFRPAATIAADERFELWSRLAAEWVLST